MRLKIKIGLFGFGCVGQGLYDILVNHHVFNAEIKTICVKDTTKERTLPREFFTFDKNDILLDKDINLVVELINDPTEALEIVSTALRLGKSVVTANKKMLADHLEELLKLQDVYGGSLLYEAACCGSIPVIRTLEEYFDNEPLNKISGIFNGSSNFILSKVCNENMSYAEALKQAQDLGFAEKDPTLDVGGFDSKNKLSIITLHTFGTIIPPENIFNAGIQNLAEEDLAYAASKGAKIKLLATSQKINKEVLPLVIPALVKADNELYFVENEFNGVLIEAQFSGNQYFKGRGAGGHPTGSAVLSDISAFSYSYKYEYKKLNHKNEYTYSTDYFLNVYLRTQNATLIKDLSALKTSKVSSIGDDFILEGNVRLDKLIEQEEIIAQDAFIALASSEFQKAEKLLDYKKEEKLA